MRVLQLTLRIQFSLSQHIYYAFKSAEACTPKNYLNLYDPIHTSIALWRVICMRIALLTEFGWWWTGTVSPPQQETWWVVTVVALRKLHMYFANHYLSSMRALSHSAAPLSKGSVSGFSAELELNGTDVFWFPGLFSLHLHTMHSPQGRTCDVSMGGQMEIWTCVHSQQAMWKEDWPHSQHQKKNLLLCPQRKASQTHNTER